MIHLQCRARPGSIDPADIAVVLKHLAGHLWKYEICGQERAQRFLKGRWLLHDNLPHDVPPHEHLKQIALVTRRVRRNNAVSR